MASRTSTPLMEDLFHCSICFYEFDGEKRKAKLLPCHHTFCSHCLSTLINASLLKCPLCSDVSSVTNVNTLKNNHYLSQFSDVLQSINSLSVNLSTSRNVSIPESDKFCIKHGNTEKFFWCKTCAITVCVHCMALDHKVEKGHQVNDISEAADDLRRKVVNAMSIINAKIAKIRDKRNEVCSINNTIIRHAIDAIQNVAAEPVTAIMNLVTDATLNPKKFSTKFSASPSAFLNQSVSGLHQADKELKEILGYFLSMEDFVDQKLMEAKVQKESRIIVGFLHPETHFDYGKMYCIRCGKMCQYPEPLATGKSNPYGVPVILNQCLDCSITILQIA